jgi:3-hydroxyacyl-[acyl-carrier-protein] dehydratase
LDILRPGVVGGACKAAVSPIQTPNSIPGHTDGAKARRVKFNLIDKIEQLSDEKIVAVKYVSLAEEYLADHFPTFPVLPGVMMLEALTQAAAWLLHRRENFRCSMAVLREARNVKYGQFVAPGNFLRVTVEYNKAGETGISFRATGEVGTQQALSARMEMAYFNLGDKQPELAEIDARLIDHNRQRWAVLKQASVSL